MCHAGSISSVCDLEGGGLGWSHDNSCPGSVNKCLDRRPFEVAPDKDGASALTHLGHTLTMVAKAACVKLADNIFVGKIQVVPFKSDLTCYSYSVGRVNEGRS